MKTLQQANFFPGLDGLRAIAAYTVLVQHTAGLLSSFGYEFFYKFNHLFLTGHQAVLLFFVLSGFLITYLLLNELKLNNKINFSLFYKKRWLRIAPLYFLIIIISFFIYLIFPYLSLPLLEPRHPLRVFLLSIILLPNFGGAQFLGATHLWSLRDENHFYLVWPLLLNFGGKIFQAIIIVIMLKIIAEFFLFNTPSLIHNWLINFNLESLAIGGIFAWIVHSQHKKILRFIFHPVMQVMIYSAIIGFIYIRDPVITMSTADLTLSVSTFVISLTFGLLIVNISCNSNSFLKLENPFLNYLGKISYGVYMFHPLVLIFTIKIYSNFISHRLELTTLTYFSGIIITTGIAILSYRYFETPCMRFKRKAQYSASQIPRTVQL